MMNIKQEPIFPELNSVHVDGLFCLVVSEGIITPEMQYETGLALNVLSHLCEARAQANPLASDARLDLTLELLLRTQHPQKPELQYCRLGFNQLVWNTQNAPISERIILSFYPVTGSSLALTFSAKVLSILERNHLTQVQAVLMDQEVNQQVLWEKWIFNQHRLAIQMREREWLI